MSAGAGKRNKHSKIDHDRLDMSKDEFNRIREALKQEEFRKLFFDYVEEIQDPANRKIYEEEITQLEKERGVEVTFIHPKPGFVIKTAIDGELKCFINIASSPEIARPHSHVAQNQVDGSRGLNWSIPMAQTGARDDYDNKKQHCKVFDVVFHPDALYLGEKNPQFRKCLIDTALDAVEREYEVSLDRANLKYPKLDYKGIARPTVIRKLNKDATSEEREPHPLEHMYPKKPDESSGQPKVLPIKTKLTPKPKFSVPKYSIKYSHGVDLAEYTDELDAKLHLTVPKALVVEIELPMLSSTADCQLDVTGKSLYLLSERSGAKYKLKLDLPFQVDDKAGNARFDTDKRRLCITLPVVRSTAKDERSMHDTLRHYSREDSGVELHSNSESPVEEEEEDEDDNAEQESIEETAQAEPTAPEPFLKDSVHYQLPSKFDCNVLDNVMALVLHVPNVQPDSLKTLQAEQSVHLQFATMGSGYYPTHYAFYIQLPSNAPQGLSVESAEAEAWDNNVILKLNLSSQTGAEALQTYLAGLKAGEEGEDLKEYAVNSQYQPKRKANQAAAHAANAPVDVSFERIEEGSALQVTIQPQSVVANATTEDDEEPDERPQKKPLSKKQRKRNKKERSLSESACEDLKAVHQKQPFNQSTEDSSPERNDVASTGSKPMATLKLPQRKQRSYSESHDSSVGSGQHRGILKRFSRYGPRPSISDSCSSIDECSSSYSCSVDGSGVAVGFSQSFGGIPEERDDNGGLSESCKKTVTFNDHIMKQVFRHDSSILGQKKKNQKRRDLKLRAQQRRLSEGDSVDYEDNTTTNLKTAAGKEQFSKHKDDHQDQKYSLHDSGLDLAGPSSTNANNKNNNEANKSTKKPRGQLEADVDAKNSMIFEMDDM